jgi:hypothetical protein
MLTVLPEVNPDPVALIIEPAGALSVLKLMVTEDVAEDEAADAEGSTCPTVNVAVAVSPNASVAVTM